MRHHKHGDDENEYRVRHKDYLIYDSEVRDMLFPPIKPLAPVINIFFIIVNCQFFLM